MLPASSLIGTAAGSPSALPVEWIAAAVAAFLVVDLLVFVWLRKRRARLQRPGPTGTSERESGAPATARTWAQGLEKTRREGFVARLSQLLARDRVDDAWVAQAEEILLTADIGVHTAQRLIDRVRSELHSQREITPTQVEALLRREVRAIVEPVSADPATYEARMATTRPWVVLVVGVNGTGKTTTIGKVAHRLVRQGRRVLIVAADTFRAAAAEQLGKWAERSGAGLWRKEEGADPASVAFSGVRHAVEENYDVVLVDTAGRLHTAGNLVRELEKIHRVTGKALEGAPHEVWLVLDATVGQNGLQQARVFLEAVKVTGIVLTKLDGTARGGILIAIADELGIPIRFVGIGEGLDDLRPFDPDAFVEALFAR